MGGVGGFERGCWTCLGENGLVVLALLGVRLETQSFGPRPGREFCLHAHYVIGQDQDNCRIGTGPNQGREPPLLWSVEFVKEVVHVESNDTEPLGFLWWRRPNPGPLRLQRSRRYFVCHRSYRACRRGAISHAIGAARIRLATTTMGIQK